MSGLEKFFVNRTAERNARGFLRIIRESGVLLPTGSSILEIGSGKGATSLLLYQDYAPKRLAVTDYDQSQVASAEAHFKGKLGKLGVVPQGVEIRTADALDLPFGDQEFDVVIASHVLHHVEKHNWDFERIPTALAEVHRVLKTGGLFIYEEIFNKSRIREDLIGRGFERLFETSNWPGNRFCIYRKGPSRSSHPIGSIDVQAQMEDGR